MKRKKDKQEQEQYTEQENDIYWIDVYQMSAVRGVTGVYVCLLYPGW